METDQSSNGSFKRRRHRRVDTSMYNCSVCGDKTNCYNFGAIACEGCKAFFRRHMSRISTMVCVKDGQCDVSKNTRKHCSACRMRKCLEVGMRRDPLTKDFVPKKRRRRLEPVVPQTSSPSTSTTDAPTPASIIAPLGAASVSGVSCAADSTRGVMCYTATQSPSLPPKKRSLAATVPSLTPTHTPVSTFTPTPTPTVAVGPAGSLAELLEASTASNYLANLCSVSTWRPISTLPAIPTLVTPLSLVPRNPTSAGSQHILDVAEGIELSDALYEEIRQNCLNFSTAQCAALKRSELDDRLFDEPLTADARFQLRFLEVRIMRAIQTLKRSRCFATLNDDEKVALLKASLFCAMTTFWGYQGQTRLASNMLVDNFEDGRIVVRDQRLFVSVFAQAGVDVSGVTTRMFSYNELLKRAFPNDWHVVLTAICILAIFPRTVSSNRLTDLEWPPFGTTASAFLNAAFEQKVAAVHREHAAFLRRFVRQVCEREALAGTPSYFGSGDLAQRSEAAWRFCEERVHELFAIGNTIQDCATAYFSRKLELSSQLTPIIHEVQRTGQRAFNAT